MLQSLSGKLSRLNDVAQIGLTIADELRLLIDYHNCRVFLREDDDLLPVAFRGDLITAAPGDPVKLLPTQVGRGITGRVAETGEPLLVGDAARHEFGEQIVGTAEIEESLLAVPLKYGPRVTGVIVISKLGLDQFDADDLRLLEVHGRARVGRARERAPVRGAAARGREREGAPRVLSRSRRGDRASPRSPSASTIGAVGHPREPEHVGLAPGAPTTGRWNGSRRSPRTNGTSRGSCESPPSTSSHGSAGASRTPSIRPTTRRSRACPREPTDASRSHRSSSTGAGASSPPRSRRSRVPDDRELELLASIARQTRLALQTAASYETLERTFLSTVEALANALEANDEYTSTHARWITDLALRVGEELGLEPHELKRLELGALFHDIGKIGIPSRILTKAGPLTTEERALVETHPILGERILAPIEQLGEVRHIVRCAHEHYDGTGYPDQLSGEQIPLESRIVLACDAFHAMTTDRPYRKSLGEDEAKRRLVEASGAQFDPQVVDALLRVLAAD